MIRQKPKFQSYVDKQFSKKPLADEWHYVASTLDGEYAYCKKHITTRFNVYKFKTCIHCFKEENKEFIKEYVEEE
jgi:hypothetical protein